jgi:ferrochelatase
VNTEDKLTANHSTLGVMACEKKRTGVLLLAHGAPERVEDVPEFLLRVRGGRALPEAAVREITQRYAQIGGGSPLLRITQLQAAKLAEMLNANSGTEKADLDADAIPVVVGMRNWKPFIPDVIRQLRETGIEKLIAICLAPQNSSTSIGLYQKRLNESLMDVDPPIEVEFIDSWHDHPGLIAAFADKICGALDRMGSNTGGAVPVIFTAHSVPQRTLDAGDPYRQQAETTARLVAESLGMEEWCLAFQSQGMTDDIWIGPTVEAEIDRLAEEGQKALLIAPIGFVSDHVEVLYDIDIVFRQYGASKGLTVWRTESLNGSPLFIRALASLVKARM